MGSVLITFPGPLIATVDFMAAARSPEGMEGLMAVTLCETRLDERFVGTERLGVAASRTGREAVASLPMLWRQDSVCPIRGSIPGNGS